jgi:hypothetical protein
MDALDYWRMCDAVSVVQAALLIIGEDPAESQEYIAGWQPENRPKGYDAVKTALLNAIKRNKLPADIPEGDDGFGNNYARWDQATVLVDDLRTWLKSAALKQDSFFQCPMVQIKRDCHPLRVL